MVERKAFSVKNIKVGKRKSVSMGERDFIVELNKDTIPYCWTTPYIFTNFTFLQPLVDSVAENNVMYTQISFHCGGGCRIRSDCWREFPATTHYTCRLAYRVPVDVVRLHKGILEVGPTEAIYICIDCMTQEAVDGSV